MGRKFFFNLFLTYLRAIHFLSLNMFCRSTPLNRLRRTNLITNYYTYIYIGCNYVIHDRYTYVAHGYFAAGVASPRPFAGRRQWGRRLALFVQLPSLDVQIAGKHDPAAARHRMSASGRLPPANGENPEVNTQFTVLHVVPGGGFPE